MPSKISELLAGKVPPPTDDSPPPPGSMPPHPSDKDFPELMAHVVPFSLYDPLAAYFAKFTQVTDKTAQELLGSVYP